MLSRCLGHVEGGRAWDFHFKGVFRGERVERIRVGGAAGAGFEDRVDYVLDLEVTGSEGGVLRTSLRRHRRLWDGELRG